MTDDVGFGAPSTFGGVIPTPALDRIAAEGLRYTNFHSTALCAPTRAALLTGRNPHMVGFGVVPEMSTGYPGYDGVITKDKATIGRVLRDNGYRTAWFGKNHNTPFSFTELYGPFDQWPTGLGFDYFYGFMGGESNQWRPGDLVRNTTYIQPFLADPDFNLITAMADEAITYVRAADTLAPEQPFFIYYVPGAAHSPHHPTKEWIERADKLHLFDQGWNALRETIFEKQKALGVIPDSARLTPWPDGLLKRWEQLSADEQKLFKRQATVFAAYLMYADHEIGRVIQAIDDLGRLDNTLIVYISGDNGTSAEGTMNGTPNEVASANLIDVPVAQQLSDFYDIWGSEATYPHMAAAWAWAFDTPFSWTKQIASHFGGTRQGMAVAWPRRIKDKGSIRHQFHHVIDILPTILDASGIAAPTEVDGIRQAPIDGVSMTYTFDAANADAPSARKTQYFEMLGDHALYHDGWILSTKVMRAPWESSGAGNSDPTSYPYELFDLSKDWTQYEDVAAAHPGKVAELTALFYQEAGKNQVFPLDASVATRQNASKPSIATGRDMYVWTGPLTGVSSTNAPSVLNTSYRFTAEIEVPETGGAGMLITQGGRFAGFGFYLLKGIPTFSWNLAGLDHKTWRGATALSPGKHVLVFDFKYDGLGADTLAYGSIAGFGRSGTGTLQVDGKIVDSKTMTRTIPFTLAWDEHLDVGSDTGTSVNVADYDIPFAFDGKIEKITLSVDAPTLSSNDIAKLKAAQAKAADGAVPPVPPDSENKR